MRRLLARHRTELHYAGQAFESVNEVRLMPSREGRQHVEWARLRITPTVEMAGYRDAFGNDVRWFQVVAGHRSLVVESEAVVRTQSPDPVVSSLSPDEQWRRIGERDHEHAALAEFLIPSTYARWPTQVDELAAEVEPARALALAEWLVALAAGVRGAIEYQRGVTGVDTPAELIAERRQGVCQDLAHIYIALCRRAGVAARYVSGWLFTPGRDEPGESHAWTEAWIPGGGWMEVDPTHPEPVDDRYIRLGTGRDYADVPPMRGTYLGAPTDELRVWVEIDELETDPRRADSAADPAG